MYWDFERSDENNEAELNGGEDMRMQFAERREQRTALTSPQELAFSICHRFDHIFTIARVEEELTTLRIRDELNEISIAAN